MNEKLDKFIELFENIDNSSTSEMGFDIDQIYISRNYSNHPCGSACCIGGWAQYMLMKDNQDKLPSHNIASSLRFVAEIPLGDCDKICFPILKWGSYDDITHDVAVKVLKYYRDTGVVDYERFIK